MPAAPNPDLMDGLLCNFCSSMRLAFMTDFVVVFCREVPSDCFSWCKANKRQFAFNKKHLHCHQVCLALKTEHLLAKFIIFTMKMYFSKKLQMLLTKINLLFFWKLIFCSQISSKNGIKFASKTGYSTAWMETQSDQRHLWIGIKDGAG